MGWRLAVALLVVAGVHRGASANGRLPGTSSITFRHGNDQDIAVGLTFGLVLSHDGGKTWAWMCEAAIGYGGDYDPDYAYSSTGALFATTIESLKVMRDGCVYSPARSGPTTVSTIAFGPDRTLYYAASQTENLVKGLDADFKIYKSLDDGARATGTKPGDPAATNDWWQTLQVAPSDPQRIYVTGYSYQPPMGGNEATRTQLLFRSVDGGATWTAMSTANLTLASNSIIEIVGIAADDPDHVYAQVRNEDNKGSDAVYRSADAGASWEQINRKPAEITGFVVRRARNARDAYDVIVATRQLGAEISHDDGAPGSWTALVDPPHIGCLTENAAGEIWACAQNYGNSEVPSDAAGIMKTSDPELATWTRVLRYQDLTEAVSCPGGTPQHDACATTWCAVCAQLGCTPSPSYGCPAPEADTPGPTKGGGCCDSGDSGASGAGGAGALVLALTLATVVLRPRRRRGPR